MACECTYRAMHEIKRVCRQLTHQAQQAWMRGDTAAADDCLVRAFETARGLLELPVVQPDGVRYVVNACFNCARYGGEDGGHFAVRQLETAAVALHALIGSDSGCLAARRAALDGYLAVCRALVHELARLNRAAEAGRVSRRFEGVWGTFGRELMPLH